MTYTELVNAIQEYTENYESVFVANIPVFIQQTETRVYNAVQLPSLRANKTGVLSANNKYLSAPDDFLSVYSLAVIENAGTAAETYHYLLNKDVNYIREAYPTPAVVHIFVQQVVIRLVCCAVVLNYSEGIH